MSSDAGPPVELKKCVRIQAQHHTLPCPSRKRPHSFIVSPMRTSSMVELAYTATIPHKTTRITRPVSFVAWRREVQRRVWVMARLGVATWPMFQPCHKKRVANGWYIRLLQVPPSHTSTMSSDSSESDDSVEESSANISPYTTPELLRQIERLQLQNTDYRDQLRKLNAGASPSPSSASASASTSSPSDPSDEHSSTFDSLGRSFCVLYEPWIKRSHHLTRAYPPSLLNLGPWHEGRYRSEDSKQAAIIAELYHHVPEEFQVYLETSPTFAKKFEGGMKSMRSYVISNIRKQARFIYPVDMSRHGQVDIYKAEYVRSGIPEIAALLKNRQLPNERYPRYPSILYKDGEIRGKNAFASSAIVKVLKVIFLGPTSLTREPGASRSGPQGLAETLGCKTLTPGAIALAAVIVRFIISDDDKFKVKGDKTSIPYHDDFDHYKEFILKNIKSPGMVATLKYLNAEVLGIHPASTTTTMASGDDNNDDDDDTAYAEEKMGMDLWEEDDRLDIAPVPASQVNTSTPPPPTPEVTPPPVPPISAVPAERETVSTTNPAEPGTTPTTSPPEPEVPTKKTRSGKSKGSSSKTVRNDVIEGNTNGGKRGKRR